MDSTSCPVYEALAHDVKRFGVQQVFGVMSDDTALLCTTLDALGVKFRNARHETNALAMADGYASATNEVAIGIIGRGPATANALLGAMQTLRSNSKVLLIFADSPNRPPEANSMGPEQKAFNASAVLTGAGLSVFRATDPASARRALADAWCAAHDGAVVLLLPTNVQLAILDPVSSDPGVRSPIRRTYPQPRASAIAAAGALLASARRPVIVAGLGAHLAGAQDAIIRLADHIGAALCTTLKAQDLFREHPANCGILGSFSNAGGRRLIGEADCVIAFGAGLNQRTTSFGTALPAGVPLIQIDTVRSNIGRWYAADVAIVSDARQAAEQLLDALPIRKAADREFRTQEVLERLAAFSPSSEFEPQNTPRTMDPRSLALELNRLLPRERNIVYDVGNFLQVASLMQIPGPSHVKHSCDFASIGLGIGTALGFACGAPDRPTVLFVGDGGFLMSMGELETIVREDIPLVVVLMNDCAYGAELHFLKMRSMPVAMSKFPDIDFEPVAAAFGFQAATVRSLDELRELAALLACPEGPIFLDCKINGAVAAPFLLETLEHENSRR